MLALIKRGFRGDGDGKMHSPPKQNKAHKSRAKPRVPAQPLPMPQPAVGEVQDARGNGCGCASAILGAQCTSCGCNAASDAAPLLCTDALNACEDNWNAYIYVCIFNIYMSL